MIEIGCGNLDYMSKLCWEQDPKSFTAIEENERLSRVPKRFLTTEIKEFIQN